jgi:hypothetical protein
MTFFTRQRCPKICIYGTTTAGRLGRGCSWSFAFLDATNKNDDRDHVAGDAHQGMRKKKEPICAAKESADGVTESSDDTGNLRQHNSAVPGHQVCWWR